MLREEIKTNFAIFEVLCDASSNRMRLIDARYRDQTGQSSTEDSVYDHLDEPPQAREGGDGQAEEQGGEGQGGDGQGGDGQAEAEGGPTAGEVYRTTSI